MLGGQVGAHAEEPENQGRQSGKKVMGIMMMGQAGALVQEPRVQPKKLRIGRQAKASTQFG